MGGNKRWRVNVYFSSPLVDGAYLVEAREFRFLFMARLFAWSQNRWSGWRQTWGEVCDQRSERNPQ
jgi:hypothetical protein